MNEREFVEWFRGFTEGVHHYGISPKQWDYLKEKLKTVTNTNSSHSYNFTEDWVTNIA